MIAKLSWRILGSVDHKTVRVNAAAIGVVPFGHLPAARILPEAADAYKFAVACRPVRS